MDLDPDKIRKKAVTTAKWMLEDLLKSGIKCNVTDIVGICRIAITSAIVTTAVTTAWSKMKEQTKPKVKAKKVRKKHF